MTSLRSCILPWAAVVAVAGGLAAQRSETSSTRATLSQGGGSLAFVPNFGQWRDPAQFVAQAAGATVRIERNQAWLELAGGADEKSGLRRVLVRCELEDSSSESTLAGVDPQPGLRHYLLGNDSTHWVRDVPGYQGVALREAWPGIEMQWRASGSALVEYSFHVDRGADPSRISLRWSGIDDVHLLSDGRLSMGSSIGVLTQSAPRAWQPLPDGSRRDVTCSFRVEAGGRLAFDLGPVDREAALVIDPGLVWSTYLSGSWDDIGHDLDSAANGDVVVGGQTHALDFPITPGVLDFTGDHYGEAFVTRIASGGDALVFSTFLGGASFPPGHLDWTRCVHVEEGDAVTVAGYTTSDDFPTTAGAFDTTFNGVQAGFGGDVFLTRLRKDGSIPLFSTYFGGEGSDFVSRIDVAASGEFTLAGRTTVSQLISNLPTSPGAYQSSITESYDLFISRFSPTASTLLWSTYLGGTNTEDLGGMAVAPDGSVYVSGTTESSNYPVTGGAFDTTFETVLGGGNAFVSALSSNGTALVASTFAGGKGTNPTGGSSGDALALTQDSPLRICITGITSPGAITINPNAYDPIGAPGIGFVMFLNASLTANLGATYLTPHTVPGQGYIGDLRFEDLVVEPSGAVTLTGWVQATALYPTTPGCFMSTNGLGDRQGFVSRLSPGLDELLYSTYVAATGGITFLYALDLDDKLQATVAGVCSGPGYPITPGAFDPTFGGSGPQFYGDAVLSRIDLLPGGVSRYGVSTPACLGAIQMGAIGAAQAGNVSFSMHCTGAPPSSLGFLALSFGELASPLPILGVLLNLDPGQLMPIQTYPSDSFGFGSRDLPIPSTAGGIDAYAQTLWVNTVACGGAGTFSASDALHVAIAP
jgi:hypothetical protein